MASGTFTIEHLTHKSTGELLPLFTTLAGLKSWISGRCYITCASEEDGLFAFEVGQDYYYTLRVLFKSSDIVEFEQVFLDKVSCSVKSVFSEESGGTRIAVTFTGEMSDVNYVTWPLEEWYRTEWTLCEIG